MNNKGYTLIEMMITLAIFTIIMFSAFSAYTIFANNTPKVKKFSNVHSDARVALLLIEKDLKSAGFGMPGELRIASDDICSTCPNSSDRIFIADGWEIIKDFTDNNEADGTISIDNYKTISDQKLQGGYFARITANQFTGDSLIKVDDIDIDSTADNDIKAQRALIIYDTGVVEGHMINSIGNTTDITLVSGDLLASDFSQATTQVVPAIAYYIAQDNGVNWLFRNNNKVLRNVSGLQLQYGYDANGNNYIDNNEWVDTITNPVPVLLKSVKTSMRVDVQDDNRTYQFNFQTISDFRN